ncbi:MAG: hypothetical protein JO077_20275 [Verrucomicrobia bacterium]|nr:hypothetical protein [Verrucomicrobiota bacterium]
MSPSAYRWSEIREPARAIVPPAVEKRIRAHYQQTMEDDNLPQKALEVFRLRFEKEPGFDNAMIKTALDLANTIFDPGNPEWGQWPEDVVQCAGLGLILGILFEKMADQIVLELPEEDLAALEVESRASSSSLCDLLFDRLTRYKQTPVRSI